MTGSGVDHTQDDTTSVAAAIERAHGLPPMSTRDATVNDLGSAIRAGAGPANGSDRSPADSQRACSSRWQSDLP